MEAFLRQSFLLGIWVEGSEPSPEPSMAISGNALSLEHPPPFCHVSLGTVPRFNVTLQHCFISMCFKMCSEEHSLNVELLYCEWPQTSAAVGASKDAFTVKTQCPELHTVLGDRGTRALLTLPVSFCKTTTLGAAHRPLQVLSRLSSCCCPFAPGCP